MRCIRVWLLVIAVLASAPSLLAAADHLTITPDHTNGVYQVGETVHWRIVWPEHTDAAQARYKLLKGGWTETSRGTLPFSNGIATLTTLFDKPGTILLEAQPPGAGRADRALGGAVASADQIRPAAPPPPDFDAFWQAKIRELEQVPANPALETVDVGKTNLSYWKIRMDNIRGSHIYGQLARPAPGTNFPALLIVQWAGVYPLERSWVTDRAADGWLALNIEAHDLPIDNPKEFYQRQFEGPLKDYWEIGNDDRDKSYFLRMFLSCYRALEYLTHRPDWDGRTLVVMGTSQGGWQSLMTAGLHPDKITAALALVPAGCDLLAPEAGRAPGWPQWWLKTKGKDAQKVHEASRYYDVANFAPHIRCLVLVGVGLIDETCPPSSVLAAFNVISTRKELVILPRSGHQDVNGSQVPYQNRVYRAWLPALRRGDPTPLAQAETDREYEKLLVLDEAAQAEIDRWRLENQALAAKGGGVTETNLERRIRERLDLVDRAYAEFLRVHPDHARAHLSYGCFLNERQDEPAAQAQWEQALALDPNNADVYNNLAGRYCETGPPKKAFDFYAKAIELNPSEPNYYHNFADALYVLRSHAAKDYDLTEQQVFERALNLYSNAARLDPRNFTFAWDFAQTYYALKPLPCDAALRAWTNALASAPMASDRDLVSLHLARVKMLASRFAEARAQLDAVTNESVAGLKASLRRALNEREKD